MAVMDKAQWKEALKASGLEGNFGYTESPWPIVAAMIVFIIMLLPFIVRWDSDAPQPAQNQSAAINRQLLMQQIMNQDQQQHFGRPRTIVRQ